MVSGTWAYSSENKIVLHATVCRKAKFRGCWRNILPEFSTLCHLLDYRVSLTWEHKDLSLLGLLLPSFPRPPLLSWLWGSCPYSLHQAKLVRVVFSGLFILESRSELLSFQSGAPTREANPSLADIEPLSQHNFSALVCRLKAQAQCILKAKFTWTLTKFKR